MSHPTYATREAISKAIDIHTSADKAADVDRIAQSVSRQIEQRMHRHFYPLTETVTYDGDKVQGDADGFYLDADLRSASAVTVDGDAPDSYTLSPVRWGAPFSRLDVDGYRGADIAVTGVWGYSDDTAPAGELSGAINSSVTTITVSNAALIGVGDLIKINDERMVVTDKAVADVGADTDEALTADKSETSVALDDTSQVHAGEVLVIDSERMLVTSVTATSIAVERAVDGSVLAAHDTNTDIFAFRSLTVSRGEAGTTAAAHSNEDPITRNVPPGPITTLCIAEAVTQLEQESAAYARTIGSGEGEQEARGKGLADIRRQADQFRRLRMAAV